MPNYTAYPKSKDTPNRKTRKGDRHKIFQKNRIAKKVERNAKRTESVSE